MIKDGKAYSFFLTTTEAKFADSKPIFDEMVRTFELTPADPSVTPARHVLSKRA